MTTVDSPRRRPPPTWMRNVIKAVWLNWRHIPDTPRLSAAAIADYLMGIAHDEPSIGEYLPEIRTIQRLIADFRNLNDVALKIAAEPVSPFGVGWPADSDDTGFLVALYGLRCYGNLVQSWDTWIEQPRYIDWENHEDSGAELRGEVSLGEEHRDVSGRPGPDKPKIMPLARAEVAVALQLKKAFGWPSDFDQLEGRQAWWMQHPLYGSGVPGEFGLIKELALRKAYAEQNSSFNDDSSDLLDILMNRPWTKFPITDTRQLTQSSVEWGSLELRWSSVWDAGPDIYAKRKLRAALSEYILGSENGLLQTRTLLNDLLAPEGIRIRLYRMMRSWSTGFNPQWFNSSPVWAAEAYLDFVTSHMGDRYRWRSRGNLGGLNEAHEPDDVVRITDPNSRNYGGPSWVAFTEDQATHFGTSHSPRSVWCLGCRRFYVPDADAVHLALGLMNGGDLASDVGLVKTVFGRYLDRPEGSPQRVTQIANLRGLIGSALENTYVDLDPRYNESNFQVREYLESLGELSLGDTFGEPWPVSEGLR